VIDPSEFKHVWDQLCVRFGQTNDAEAAAAYLEYLTDQMETGQFIQAARALWATNRWFPRPADFVLVGAAREWKLVIQAAEAYVPPNWSWQTPWSQLSKRAQEACKALGGMTTVRTGRRTFQSSSTSGKGPTSRRRPRKYSRCRPFR
jgi:hypothetical protein